jgi:hypothetical protein
MFERHEPRSAARGLPRLTANALTQFGMSHNGPQHLRLMFDAFSSRELESNYGSSPSFENAMHYDSLPTDFSSSSQAWSPYLPFHSA